MTPVLLETWICVIMIERIFMCSETYLDSSFSTKFFTFLLNNPAPKLNL